MNIRLTVGLLIVVLATAASPAQTPLGTAFTYQGRLNQAGQAYNGPADLLFDLYDAGVGGNLLGSHVLNGVVVTNGLFTVVLNAAGQFGASAFNGEQRWLEISVNGTLVVPRQPLTPAPYALFSVGPWQTSGADVFYTAGRVGIGRSGPLAALDVNGTAIVTGFQLASEPAAGSVLTSDASGFGTWQAPPCNCPPAWILAGNAGTNPPTQFLGTTDPKPLVIKVNNTQAMRYSDSSTAQYRSINTLGGADINSIAAGVVGATIAGGGQDFFIGTDYPNAITADFGTIGGGGGHLVSGFAATIAGGAANTASNQDATVSGGRFNTASGFTAAVGGGVNNAAAGYIGTVAGGQSNSAGNAYTSVGGGNFNLANGFSSTIAGGGINSAAADYTTIGGGSNNSANDPYATIAGGDQNTANGRASTIAGGASNVITAGFDNVTIGGGAQNSGGGLAATIGGGTLNVTSNQYTTVSGGTQNNASGDTATISGGSLNIASNEYTVIGGGLQNQALGIRATVGGGFINQATASYATVGGGRENLALFSDSTVSGGHNNTANSGYAVVGGGNANVASGFASVVAAGELGLAGGRGSTVSGGAQNTSSGDLATVPGGEFNIAQGKFSYAAGQQAQALHDGAWVWADNSNAVFASTAASQFLIRAAGNVGIATNSPTTQLHVIGTITGTVKNFLIDHPLDPANKTLRHASIESDEMLNLYSGSVITDGRGRAVVSVPEWFAALNADIRYQLTVAGGDDDEFVQAKVARELERGSFVIRTSRPGVKVFWQLIGTRRDAYARAHPLVVEEEKPEAQRGYYLNPEEHGQPAEKGVNYAPVPGASQSPGR